MKYIITENQFDKINKVKRVILRRKREIIDMMWEMLNTDVGEEASDYDSNEYVE